MHLKVSDMSSSSLRGMNNRADDISPVSIFSRNRGSRFYDEDNQFLMVANSTQNNEMKQRSLQRLVDIEENFHQVSNSPPKKISPTHFQPNLSTVQHNLNLLEKSEAGVQEHRKE